MWFRFSSCSSPFSRWIISHLSSTKFFVGGLLYDTNETILKDAFKPHGEIIEENAASNALKEMDGKLLDGRDIHVLYAHGRRQQ